ncbi:MAG: acyl-ACP--UDP-N-acetylglucosamine O-acyltransferase [Gammaproteobacteria bacterium]|nr:acyl-ACP--UDP-N-acetylglucosamine O-acyltransferase [Gammaproteobacteria bacterium]
MIHPTAIIDAGAQLAAGVEVGPYSVIGPDVTVGENTKIDAQVIITGPTSIGGHNHIFSQASIGAAPQDKKYNGEPTRLEIGDHNTIREFCTINRGTAQDRGVTTIGNHNWIMAYVHIAHDVIVGDHTILANNATLAGHVEVGDYAILGGFTKAHQFCRIGAHSFCAMDTGLSKDLPPYVVAAGHLAEPKGINSEGLSRRDYTAAQIRNIKSAYKTIYRSGLKLSEAVAALEKQREEAPELEILIRFLATTERSIIR